LQAKHSVPTWHTFLGRGEFGTFLERRLWPVFVCRALIRNSWQYLQLHAAVPAVTRRVPWPASTNASTATCGYRLCTCGSCVLPWPAPREIETASERTDAATAAVPAARRTRPHSRAADGCVPAALAVARRSSSSAGRESYGGCALGVAAPNGVSGFFSLAFRRCPIDDLRRLCHALAKTLLRSSLPSAADLGHASRDVERFHCGIWTELGLLRW
jgi:hypothetical protein